MADFTFNSFFLKGYDASTKINLASGGDTIKLALLADTYTPDRDTHEFFDDVSGDEIAGTGYTAGGATIGTQTYTQDNPLDSAVFDGDAVEWTSSTITARYGVIYKDTGTPSTSPLIQLIDFGANQSTSGSTFRITPSANGYFRVTNA